MNKREELSEREQACYLRGLQHGSTIAYLESIQWRADVPSELAGRSAAQNIKRQIDALIEKAQPQAREGATEESDG